MPRLSPTVRVFAVSLMLSAPCGRAQNTGARYPLDRSAVIAALQRLMLPISTAKVDLPVAMTSAVERPTLDISTADLLSDGRIRIRFSCQLPYACTPFFATLTPRDAQEGALDLGILTLAAHSTIPKPEDHGLALQAGKRTTLVMDDDHVHIELPVVAIDSGALGMEVRVCSLDRKTTYHGVVTQGAIVRGFLP